MIVYHGSTEIIEKPDVSFSKDFLDFGKGFYVTTHKEQAEKWALRKCVRKGGIAVVNKYDLKPIDAYRVLSFKDEDEDWLDFVCSCCRDRRFKSCRIDSLAGGAGALNVRGTSV